MWTDYPEDLTQIIHNKNVCIVFPSKAMESYELGKKIDNFDTVARIGNGFKVDGIEKHIGSRTDLLFHSLRKKVEWQGIEQLDFKYLAKTGTKYILYKNIQQNRLRKIRQKNALRANNLIALPCPKHILIHLRQKIKEKKIDRKINVKFNMLQGVCAITTILGMEPKSLCLFGKDFYSTGHQKNYKTKDICPQLIKQRTNRAHNLNKMKMLTTICIEAYDNLFIDEITKNALLSQKKISTKMISKIINQTIK